jgi:pimeloyl-ACP methyl ester carboxylesterase
MFFLAQRYRVIAHDRRSHGRLTRLLTATIWTPMPPPLLRRARSWVSPIPFISVIQSAAAK